MPKRKAELPVMKEYIKCDMIRERINEHHQTTDNREAKRTSNYDLKTSYSHLDPIAIGVLCVCLLFFSISVMC